MMIFINFHVKGDLKLNCNAYKVFTPDVLLYCLQHKVTLSVIKLNLTLINSEGRSTGQTGGAGVKFSPTTAESLDWICGSCISGL